jgi:hypothetical protein
MILKPALPLACALAALVSTGTTRVHALSCALPEVVVPLPDSVHVPTNTLVWCSKERNQPSTPILLRDALGASVSGTQTELSLPGMDVLVFRPDAELAANTEYTAECPLRWEGQAPSHVFTTGPGSRAIPPKVPSVARMDITANPDGGWGASYYASFLGAGEAQTILLVDLERNASLSPDAPSGSVADAHFNYVASDVFVGNGPCGGSWPGAGPGATTTVALGAFDMTGAFSGWSDTVTVTIPRDAKVIQEPEVDDSDTSDPPDADPDRVDGGGENDEVRDEGAVGVADDAVALAPPIIPDEGITATERSGCDLGTRGASPWGAASLLTALAWLGARRRRAS